MIWGAICSVASSIGGAICSAVSSIGSGLTSFVSNIAPTLANIIDAIKPIAKAIGEFANAFLQGLDILKPDEKLEDIGVPCAASRPKGYHPRQVRQLRGLHGCSAFDRRPGDRCTTQPHRKDRRRPGRRHHRRRRQIPGRAAAVASAACGCCLSQTREYFTAERMQSLENLRTAGGGHLCLLGKTPFRRRITQHREESGSRC